MYCLHEQIEKRTLESNLNLEGTLSVVGPESYGGVKRPTVGQTREERMRSATGGVLQDTSERPYTSYMGRSREKKNCTISADMGAAPVIQ